MRINTAWSPKLRTILYATRMPGGDNNNPKLTMPSENNNHVTRYNIKLPIKLAEALYLANWVQICFIVCMYLHIYSQFFFNWFAAFNFMMGGDKLQLHGAQCLGHEFKWQHEASRSHWKTEENAYCGSVLKSKWWRFILTNQRGSIKLHCNTKLSFQQTIHTV